MSQDKWVACPDMILLGAVGSGLFRFEVSMNLQTVTISWVWGVFGFQLPYLHCKNNYLRYFLMDTNAQMISSPMGGGRMKELQIVGSNPPAYNRNCII